MADFGEQLLLLQNNFQKNFWENSVNGIIPRRRRLRGSAGYSARTLHCIPCKLLSRKEFFHGGSARSAIVRDELFSGVHAFLCHQSSHS